LFQINGRFVQVSEEPSFSSRKLEMLGWNIRPLEETLRDSVESYRTAGVLDRATDVHVLHELEKPVEGFSANTDHNGTFL
jgi:hypothetical protein